MFDIISFWFAYSVMAYPVVLLLLSVLFLALGLIVKDFTNGEHELEGIKGVFFKYSGISSIHKKLLDWLDDDFFIGVFWFLCIIWTVISFIVGYKHYDSPHHFLTYCANQVLFLGPYVLGLAAYLVSRLTIKSAYAKFSKLKRKLENM